MIILAWLLSLVMAFSAGANSADTSSKETDDELRARVQEHIDTIVDEGAAIVDEITDEIRENEHVKEAEQFARDVQEIAEDTAEELNQVFDNTKQRIEEKFGSPEETPATVPEETPASAPETEEQPEEQAEPAETVYVND